MQGIISRIGEVYFDGLPSRFSWKFFTFRELIKCNSTYAKSLLYKYNSRYEKEIFQRVHYANTVNSWDTSWAKQFNPQIKCFQIQYNLRDSFYNSEKWSLSKVKRHRIFTNPGGDSIKGLHMLCQALAIVKKTYPDVFLVVPGRDLRKNIQNGYDKYIVHLMKTLGIENNISFVGRLSEEEMLQNMLESHVVVIPSAIEGASLVLREAMYVGVPCIASFRGGMADFIQDKISGFLYDYNEVVYLANRIMQLFSDDCLANTFSKNAILQAEKAHDRKKNVNDCLKMYHAIYED